MTIYKNGLIIFLKTGLSVSSFSVTGLIFGNDQDSVLGGYDAD